MGMYGGTLFVLCCQSRVGAECLLIIQEIHAKAIVQPLAHRARGGHENRKKEEKAARSGSDITTTPPVIHLLGKYALQ